MVQTEQTLSAPVVASQERPSMAWWRVFGDPRLPLQTFAVVEVVALVRVLALSPNKWFAYDEWEFLSGRTAGSLHSVFRPTLGSWMTLPILLYRAVYQLFGLRAYLPYELVLIVLHLIAAALVLTVMRRVGVFPWLAVAAASLFALFGSGWEDIIWAFQMGFVGALVLGLTQLLLTDHDGRIDRRDWLGLLAGMGALLCNGVGVVMVVVVGIAALLHRGWRAALFSTAPLAAVYVVWWFGYANTYYRGLNRSMDPATLARWTWAGVRSSFGAMGQLEGMGIILAILLVVGLALAWIPLDFAQFRTQAAMPAALLIGAFLFLISVGYSRHTFGDFKLSHASDSGYLYIFVAMTLPAIAVALYAIGRLWRPLLFVAIVPLLIGIPGNYEAFASRPTGLYQTQAEEAYRQTMVALATVPAAQEVPRSTQIGDFTALFRPEPAPLDVSLGWLLDQKASGKLPDVGPLNPRVEADATLALALRQSQSAANSLSTGSSSALGQGTTQEANPAPGGSPLVRVASNPKDGPLLVDSNGMTLYSLTVGLRPIPCTAACAGIWHPLLAPSAGVAPTGGPGVTGLGTSASGEVVTDFGYPLYLYSGDKTPGQTTGDGIKSFGGTWQVIRVHPPKTCSSLTTPVTKVLQKYQSMTFTGALGVIYESGKAQSDETIFEPTYGELLTALAGPLKLQLLPAGGTTSVCI